MANGLIEAAGEALTSTNPRGRLGEKEDIQSLLIFLCSKQSNYVNGIIVPLDGGAHNNQPAAHFRCMYFIGKLNNLLLLWPVF